MELEESTNEFIDNSYLHVNNKPLMGYESLVVVGLEIKVQSDNRN